MVRLQTSGTECRFMIMHLTRRHFLQTTSLALASAYTHVFAAEDPLIESIEKVVVKTPALPKGTWFHPRACMVGKKAFMTTQPIVGSDHFGHVHWTTSDDLGQTWSDFTPAPFATSRPSFIRRPAACWRLVTMSSIETEASSATNRRAGRSTPCGKTARGGHGASSCGTTRVPPRSTRTIAVSAMCCPMAMCS
jgi:hypothetical protein